MVDEIQPQRVWVSPPDAQGHRSFYIQAMATNYNTATPLGTANLLRAQLSAFCSTAIVKQIHIWYTGGLGITLAPGIGTAGFQTYYLPTQVTTQANDYLLWNCYCPIDVKALPLVYDCWVNAANYAATDDFTMIFVGEAW